MKEEKILLALLATITGIMIVAILTALFSPQPKNTTIDNLENKIEHLQQRMDIAAKLNCQSAFNYRVAQELQQFQCNNYNPDDCNRPLEFWKAYWNDFICEMAR